ncbi:hypothetical protein GOODEAATRI_024606, partial [Goodea atripinnis]
SPFLSPTLTSRTLLNILMENHAKPDQGMTTVVKASVSGYYQEGAPSKTVSG